MGIVVHFETSCLDGQLMTFHTASVAPGLRRDVSPGRSPYNRPNPRVSMVLVFPVFTLLSSASVSFPVLSVLSHGRYLSRESTSNSHVA